jgi:hypothetical protein
MTKDNKILEGAGDVFETSITAEELQARKVALARVLDLAESALDKAEDTGNTELADKLRDKVDNLQELLDRAEEDFESAEAGDSSDSDPEEDELDDTDTSTSSDDDDEEEDDDEDDEEDEEDEDEPGEEPDTDDESEEEENEDEEDSDDEGDSGNGDDKESEDETEDDDESETEDESETSSSEEDESDESDSDKEGGDSSSGGSKDEENEDEEESGSETDESDGDEESSSTSADSEGEAKSSKQINPFAKKQPAGAGTPPAPDDQESVFDAAKRILSKLTGEAREGAVAGLKDLLAKRGYSESLDRTSLQEAIKKTLSRMTDDEFNDEIASVMDLVDKVIDVDYSDDLDARVAEINRDASSALSRMELEKEDAEHTKAEKAALKASEKENDKYRKIKGLPGLDAFRSNLYRAIKDQVIAMEEDEESWAALDRRHEDDPSIIKKGYIKDDVFEEGIPTINVYFDQSGSWRDSDIEIGKRAISVINDFHEKGEIKLQIFYMSAGGIFTNAAAARADGRAEGWKAALDHIKSSKVKNVIILSDSDLDSFEWCNRPTGNNGLTRVDGCVWWLWKDSDTSEKALKELKGRQGNFQYQFEGAGY